MRRLSKIITFAVITAGLLSCTCATPLKVTEIQKTDKKLSCKEVILEINEAEHYRELAKNEEGIRFGNMLMPVCWVTSYVDAGQAINSAEERVKYLGHIYDVLDCGGKSDKGDKPAAAGTAPLIAPPVIQLQPVQPQALQSEQATREQQPQAQQRTQAAPKEGLCITKEEIAKYTHQHVDRLGRVYIHCHVNSGPHRHAED